ncbi:MAG: lysophospholipid acyltransferase family protein [Bacillota bacterium]
MKKRLKSWLISRAAWLLIVILSSTLRVEVSGRKRLEELRAQDKKLIFAFWHGKMLLPIYYFRQHGYHGLASQSRDGEYISGVLTKLGWQVVRGSTSRGSVKALLELIKALRAGDNVAITPDGPRGPRHETKLGTVYLAKKSQDSLIIPVGVSFSKQKIINSWDHFNLPYPFAKASLYFGTPIAVDSEADKSVIEDKRQEVNSALRAANQQAERKLAELG